MIKFNPGTMTWKELLAYKHRQFSFYRDAYSLKTFIETGTNSGDSVEFARHLFKAVYSFELDPRLYAYCRDKFKDADNVHLIFGDSEIELEKLTGEVPNENILFWLDAHANEGELPAKHSFSGFIELENLLKRPLKNCVILVDDIREGEFYDELMRIAPNAKVEMSIGKVVIP